MSGQPSSSEWLVVLRANGVVDSVHGGAPVTWLGHPLVSAPGTAGVLRRAAADLLRDAASANVRRRVVRCVEDGVEVDVELLLVEAVPLRRTHSRVFDLVTRTLEFFASQAKASEIDLTIDKADNVPAAFVFDGEKIAWALATLVANALRYARKHVAVHVRYEEDDPALAIDVADDGPGMPASQARWLFEPNPSTGRSTGLALLMVRDVLHAHRGIVSVATEPGRGTTFTMRLPRITGVS